MKYLSRIVMSAALAWSGWASAASTGPFDDGNFHLGNGPVARWIQTTWKSGNISGTDLIHIKKDGSVDVYVQANLFVLPGPSVGATPADVDLVTVYGKQAPGGPLTGFDAADQVSFAADASVGFSGQEQHWGGSGSGRSFFSYSAQTVLASQLAGSLAGVDLSAFDTTSGVQTYAVFRTSVPLSEITTAVPEPGMAALWLVGVVGLGGLAARRRRLVTILGPCPAP